VAEMKAMLVLENRNINYLIEVAKKRTKPVGLTKAKELLALLSTLPRRKMDDCVDAKSWISMMLFGLNDIPEDLLKTAVMKAIRTCKFCPAPAELRELIKPDLEKRGFILSRLYECVEVSEEEKSRIRKYRCESERKRLLQDQKSDFYKAHQIAFVFICNFFEKRFACVDLGQQSRMEIVRYHPGFDQDEYKREKKTKIYEIAEKLKQKYKHLH